MNFVFEVFSLLFIYLYILFLIKVQTIKQALSTHIYRLYIKTKHLANSSVEARI